MSIFIKAGTDYYGEYESANPNANNITISQNGITAKTTLDNFQLNGSGFTTNALTATWADTHTTVARTPALSALSNPLTLALKNKLLVLDQDVAPTCAIGIQADNTGTVGTNFGIEIVNTANNNDFEIRTDPSYTGSVVFKEFGIGATTKQTAIQQATITLSDTAAQPKTVITDTQIQIDENFSTTTPNTATLTAGNLEIRGVNGPASTVTTTDINPASIVLANTGDPTTIFTTTGLTSGSATATWADIISGAAGDNTLQEVLTAGNTATNLLINLTNGSGSTLSLSPVASNVGAVESFTPVVPFNTAQTIVQLGASSGDISSSINIQDSSTPASYQTIGQIIQSGDKINDPFNVKPQLQMFETATGGAGTYTREALYRASGITHTSDTSYTVNSNQQFLLNSTNLAVGATTLTLPPAGNPITAQLTEDGLTMNDTTNSWFSYYRKSAAYISNITNTIYTQILNGGINFLSTGGISGSVGASGATFNSTTGGTAQANLQPTKLFIQSPLAGYSAQSMIELFNSNATVGNTTGVPSFDFYKFGRNVVQNDVINSIFCYAKNYLGTKTLFSKIETVVTNSSAGGGDDGALDFYTCVNGTPSLVMRLNGADNENNSFRPLDMNGNNIRTATGNMTIDTTGSSGPGILTLSSKQSIVINSGGGSNIALNTSSGNLTVDTGATGGIQLTGTALQSASSGGNSGQHLVITLNGVQYKIALQNP